MTETPDDTSKIDRDRIDWSKIVFPSDRLTLGQLRKATGHSQADLEVLSHNLIAAETEVILDVLSSQVASFDIESQRTWRIMIDEDAKALGELYIDVGLAAGPHEASLIVKDFISLLSQENALKK